VGLDTLDDALRLHVLDIIAPQYRKTVRTKSGLWCFVPAGGRESLSSGNLDPVNQSPS
jgi:hypothetical protein